MVPTLLFLSLHSRLHHHVNPSLTISVLLFSILHLPFVFTQLINPHLYALLHPTKPQVNTSVARFSHLILDGRFLRGGRSGEPAVVIYHATFRSVFFVSVPLVICHLLAATILGLTLRRGW